MERKALIQQYECTLALGDYNSSERLWSPLLLLTSYWNISSGSRLMDREMAFAHLPGQVSDKKKNVTAKLQSETRLVHTHKQGHEGKYVHICECMCIYLQC